MRRFGVYVFLLLILVSSCVGSVQIKKMELNVERKQPVILNLKNAGNADGNLDTFIQSERLVKGALVQATGDEWGYYDVKFGIERWNNNFGAGLGQIGATLGVTIFLGVPTDWSRFELSASLYIFDSNGNFVREYHDADKLTVVAGLYYGYNPTKKVAKKFSKLYEKMFELAWMQSNEINKALQKAGKVTEEKDSIARQRIRDFYKTKYVNVGQNTATTNMGTFKEGLYALSGKNFRLSFSNGAVAFLENNITVMRGTYEILNNQLIITYQQSITGPLTYTYTILNSTEFSSGDQLWKYIE